MGDVPNKDLFLPNAAPTCSSLRYRFGATTAKERIDNITSWAREQIQAAIQKIWQKKSPITRDDNLRLRLCRAARSRSIASAMRSNLKREFPRIPFYPDFRKWVDWGNALLALHIGYENVDPWPLKRLDAPDERARAAGVAPKAMLKADKR